MSVATVDNLPSPSAERPIGFGRLKRKEDPRFIRGQGTYLDDIKLPGMVYGAVLRSPVLGTRITAWLGRAIAVAVVVFPLWQIMRAGGAGGVSLLTLVWSLLIAAMLATVVALVRGIIAFLQESTAEVKGDGPSRAALKSNRMMQQRIFFQAIAVLVVVVLLFAAGRT